MKYPRLAASVASLLCFIGALALEYGLSVVTYPKAFTEFTSLLLDEGNPIDASGKPIKIAFDTQLRPENPFGQVLRMKGADGANIEFVFGIRNNYDDIYPIFVVGDSTYILPTQVSMNTWDHVSLAIDPAQQIATLRFQNDSITISNPTLARFTDPQIGFGKATFSKFTAKEVASVNIRDIEIYSGSKLIRSWKLAKHKADTAFDEVTGAKAVAENGIWLIDDSRKWKHIFSHEFPDNVSVAFNPDDDIFYFVGRGSELFTFDIDDMKFDSIDAAGCNVANYPNQLIYLPDKKELLSFNINENLYSSFDFDNNTWTGDQLPKGDHNFWHNSNNYVPERNIIVSFGGYGHYQIKNTLVITDLNDHTQQRIDLAGISPKRMHSAAVVNDTLYIFGGIESRSGKQELTQDNDFTLYAISLNDYAVTRVWDMPPFESERFTFAENMVPDPESDAFFVLSNYNNGILTKISTRFDEPVELSSEVQDVEMSGQYMYVNLFLSERAERFYAVVCTTDVGGGSYVNIVELPYPAYSEAEWDATLNAVDTSKEPRKISGRWLYLLGALLVLAIAAYLFLTSGKSAKLKAKLPIKARDAEPELDSQKISDADTKQEFSKGAIRFLGGFRVYANDGEDITSQFTPTLRSLMILLVVKTAYDSRGIHSTKMHEILWGGRDADSAKNNRNVNMSRLRGLASRIGNVSVVCENRTFWRIEMGEGTRCDYLEALRLFREPITEESIERIISILSLGPLLPNTDFDWLDEYKTKFSDMTIDVLTNHINSDSLSDSLKLRIADTLFVYDFLNENALFTKCRIFYKLGKNGLAKNIYDTYCRSYKESFGTDYPQSLSDILAEA